MDFLGCGHEYTGQSFREYPNGLTVCFVCLSPALGKAVKVKCTVK